MVVILLPVAAAAASVVDSLNQTAKLLQMGRTREALKTLEIVEKAEPENPWLWFYRGTARLHLSEPYKAMEDYDRALGILADLGDPDPKLADNIRRHHRRARQQVFGFSWNLGLAFDTNVTYVGDDTTGTADLISGEEDGKFGSQFQIDYAPLANQQETLALGLRLGHTWHFSVEEFNYQDYGAYIRYARRLGSNFEVSLRYDYDITFLGNEPFLSNHALTPGITYYWDPIDFPLQLDRTNVYYQLEGRDYLFETLPEFDRDGLAQAVGCEQSFIIKAHPQWQWDLSAGYRFTSISTEGREFDRPTHDFYLSLGIPLVNPANPQEYLLIPDKELTFRFNVQWHHADYRNDSLIDSQGNKRSDVITAYDWMLSQKLVEDPHIGDITLHAIIHWTDANSNLRVRDNPNRRIETSPFTYDKVVYGIQLEWAW
jgi:tetratricopeptide (TPR) repeat protein